MTRPNNNSNVAVVFDESDDILTNGIHFEWSE